MAPRPDLDAGSSVTDSEPFNLELEDPSARALGRIRFWKVVIVAVLAGGLTLSAIGAYAWYGYVQAQAKNAFREDASNISAAISSELRRDVDFVADQRAGIVAIPDLSNRELAIWYKSVGVNQRFPGAIGFAFVERVLPSQLRAFGAEVIADPPINETVTAPYTVFPPVKRSQYCLQRFAIATSPAAKVIPPTFDFCSPTIPPWTDPSAIPSLLQQATDSGEPTVLNAGRIAKSSGLAGLFVIFSPVYNGATTPTSEPSRRSDLHGWIVATFNGPALLRSDVANDPGLAVSVLFDEPLSGTQEIASAGPTPSGPLFTQTLRFNAEGSWVVQVTGSAHSTAITQGVGVGVLGAGLSALLFLLFLFLTRSRTMALRMVEKRTRQLRHQALYDALTGLPTRALILDRAEKMLARARRHPLVIGALFIDLDNFKEVNDTFGHQIGDELLKAVGVRLSEVLRASDSVGRLGGDEFIVLAEGDVGTSGPEVVAERLLGAFSQPFSVDDRDVGPLNVTVSIGVAVGDRDGAAELLRDADVALYEAKARGKHRYVVFDNEERTGHTKPIGLELEKRPVVGTKQ